MNVITRNRRSKALAAVVAGLIVAGCGSGLLRPSPERMATDVAGLADVVPLVEALRLTDFEDDGTCTIAAYAGADVTLARDERVS